MPRNRKAKRQSRPGKKHAGTKEQARRVISSLGGVGLTEAMDHLAEIAVALTQELQDCTHFIFLEQKHIDQLAAGGHQLAPHAFWSKLNQLLIYAVRTEAAAAEKLVDALLWACAARNELTLALASRALIEHASATDGLWSAISPAGSSLQEGWPTFASLNGTVPDDGMRAMSDELVRFAMGRRVQSKFPLPLPSDSAGSWERFNKSLADVPAELKARGVLGDIDKAGPRNGLPALRAIYEFLSEYCHPNSSSRTFEFLRYQQHVQITAKLSGQQDFTVGMRHLASLATSALPTVCRMFASALLTLNKTRQPMFPLNEYEKRREPPPGAIRIVDNFGRPSWADLDRLVVPDVVGVKLSAEQEARVRAVHAVFADYAADSVDEAIIDFGRELDPESRIRFREHAARVYQTELAERGESSMLESTRFLVYVAVLRSPEANSIDELLQLVPELSELRHVERIYERMHGRPGS